MSETRDTAGAAQQGRRPVRVTGATWASIRLRERIRHNGRALTAARQAAEQLTVPGRDPLADLEAEP